MSTNANPPRKSSDGGWMDTYADIITLLLAFFVILYSMSSLKKEMFESIAEQIVQGQQKGFAEQVRSIQPSKETKSNSKTVKLFVPKLKESSFLKNVVGIEEENSSYESKLVFPADALFVPGSTALVKKSEVAFKQTAAYLNRLDPKYFDISIEGHYDANSPIPTGYSNKWEFSAARALNVRKALIQSGYKHKNNIYIAAFADSRPIAKEKSGKMLLPKNQAKNRRIVIFAHAKR